MSRTAIITVNYYSSELIHGLEEVIADLPSASLWVTDNSGDFQGVSPSTNVIRPGKNLGFGRACNLAVLGMDADVLLFVNPDVKIDAKTLAGLTNDVDLDSIWGPVIEDRFGRSSSVVSTERGTLSRVTYPIGMAAAVPSIYISGACFGIGRDLFLQLGGFDENIFMYAEDLDFCIRARRANKKIRLLSQYKVLHDSGTASGNKVSAVRRRLYSLRGHIGCLTKYYSFGRALFLAWYLSSGRSTLLKSS